MNITFQNYSIFWLLFCLLLSVSYAYFLYRSENKLSILLKRILFLSRTIVVLIISIFLFSPLITKNQLTYEKPIVLVAQDNSQSILLNSKSSYYKNEYLASRKEFIQKISEKFDVKDLSIGTNVQMNKEIDYSDYKSDLSLVFKEALNSYKNRNLAAIVLASDGIHNTGPEPLSYVKQLTCPVYSVLLGDSTLKKDLQIKSIVNNEIVYLKNDFVAEIKLSAFDLAGLNANLSIVHNGKTVWKSIQKIDSKNQQIIVQAILNALEPGLQKFTLNAQILPGEKNLKNNSMDFYIDVIENKQQIALIASAPHPDLAAIKQSLEQNENYKVDLFMADQFNLSDLNKYQLLILHQIPSSQANMSALFNNIEKNGIPTWIILGNQNYLDLFNRLPYGLKILNSRSNANEVFAIRKSEFQGFVLSEQWTEFLTQLPPLLAPFGNYRVSNSMQTLFAQKIGSVETEQPLLAFGTIGSTKYSILAAEGIWKWRMQNMRMKGNSELVDELCSKLVQYLSAKDDKRKFRVVMPSRKFDQGENVFINAELYNGSYELVNTPDVKLVLSNEKKNKYNFLFSRKEKNYELNLGSLPAGEYIYKAETSLGNQKYEGTGKFTVLKNNLEELNATADFSNLRTLSKLSGARAFEANEYSKLADDLLKNNSFKTISYEEKKTDEWISLHWIFFLIISLFTFEWLMRKYQGLY